MGLVRRALTAMCFTVNIYAKIRDPWENIEMLK